MMMSKGNREGILLTMLESAGEKDLSSSGIE